MRTLILSALIVLLPAAVSAKTLDELLVEKGVISKAEASATSSAAEKKLYWDEGTRIEFPSEGITTKITAELYERYTYTDRDSDDEAGDTSSFENKRAKIAIEGTALDEEFSYVVQWNMLGDSDGSERTPALEDAYIKWQGCECSALKMGQFKTGISRQFLNSDAKLQFADRSVTSEFFSLGRNQGASASYNFEEDLGQVEAAIFNGTSEGEGINRPGVDTNHLGVVTGRFNVMGKMDPYAEGDYGYSEDAAVAVGAAYAYGESTQDLGGAGEDLERNSISADVSFKYSGWSANAEYYYSTLNPDDSEDIDTSGFYVQGGYFIEPKRVELAARYAYIECDDGRGGGVCDGNDKVNEVTAGVNYYFWNHYMKAQFNYVFLNEDQVGADSEELNSNRWILQVSALM